jgi:hypothetical protein
VAINAVRPFVPEAYPADSDNAAQHPEDLVSLPWGVDPKVSWLDYNCWVEISLDAGMALHKILPQDDPDVDTLALLDMNASNLDTFKPTNGGVNLASNSDAEDIIQRMASSTYTFVLRGYGQRVGYQIPIPGITAVGAQNAVPGQVQRAYNKIIGNMMGVPVWFAEWWLEYIISGPIGPSPDPLIPSNPAFHIGPDAVLPLSILVPRAGIDQAAINSQTSGPTPSPLQ